MNDKLTDKIQHLLAMAEHPNSNEHEAALALERAQALLLEHNLTRADILSPDNGTPAGIGQLSHTEKDGYTWKRGLVNVLAKSNLCRIIGSPSSKTWHIFGTYDNVRAVLDMYNWITLQLVFMANREYRAYKNDEGTERGQTWKLGFYQGATETIRERLAKPLETFTYGTGKDLVLRNDTSLTEAVKKVFPSLTRSTSYAARSYDGRSAGKAAGRGMTLTPAKRLGSTMALGPGR